MKSFRECSAAAWTMSTGVRWRMVVSVLVGLVRIAASLGFVWSSKLLVDIATGNNAMPLKTAIGVFAGILFLQISTFIFSSWWESYTLVKTQNTLRIQLFGHVLRSRWDGRDRFLSGDTVNRLEEDIRVVADLLGSRVPGLVITLLQLVAASAYLLLLAPNLLWVLLILMFAAVFGSKLFFRQLRKLMAAIRARESELQQVMQESLQHRVLVLTLTNVERVLEKFGWLQSEVEDNTRKRLNYNAVSRGLMFLGFQAGHAAAFLWGILGILHGTVTYGTMTAFLQLVGQVQRPIAEFGRQVPAIINALTSIERLMELQELEEEPRQESVRLEKAPEIVVSHLTYSYPGAPEPILKDFSCTFPSGKMSVIAGHTGIGKSTLLRLVMGLLQPSEGSVTLDGIPAGPAIRSNFLYVPQGNSLLSGTIRSNLLLAQPKATDHQMKKALETAAASFVYSLPHGLDTPCGEVGSGLSEGQAQRIAVARALLHPGSVLILDESTSALDAQTEKTLIENLHQKYHGSKTILFISHRPAAMEVADQVIEIKAQDA
ncbi:MAG: ABC transporter ATP-binding protein [Bacteroidales bacterium]|nr:ABC transporter ATP-binding protein [Bacteroidales bacterium]